MIDLFLLNSGNSEERFFELSSDPRFRIHAWNTPDNDNNSRMSDVRSITHNEELPFFVICEEDNFLTSDYDNAKLISIVYEASQLGADIVFGGAADFGYALPLSESLFWVENCFNPCFAIILPNFFSHILSNGLNNIRSLEDLNKIASNKFLTYPFISKRKFTSQTTMDSSLYSTTMERLTAIKEVKEHYSLSGTTNISDYDMESITIPTYVINLESRTERLNHIWNQFCDKPEFDLYITRACKHERGATGLWQSICSIVKTATVNNDDVIIIVEDDHMFTEHYDRNIFLTNIIQAGAQGADILCGGISGGFQYAIPITEKRYWINYFWGTQFIIVYKKMFEYILNSKFKSTDTADDFLSSLTANKMVLFPFISIQKDFGYSDITLISEERGDLSKIFVQAENRLRTYGLAYQRYIKNSFLS